LLAEVYLSMTRGQNSLSMDLGTQESEENGIVLEVVSIAEVIVLAANEDELIEHEATVKGLDKEVRGQSLWRLAESH
jgi:DNA polymerase III subunit epsilon